MVQFNKFVTCTQQDGNNQIQHSCIHLMSAYIFEKSWFVSYIYKLH